MNKFYFCVLALSFAAVYVDCASLKSNTVPYELSMQRFTDLVQSYKTRFPSSNLIDGVLEILSDPELDGAPFFPYVVLLNWYPTVQLGQTFGPKVYEILQYLNMDPQSINLDIMSHLTTLWQLPNTPANMERVSHFGKPLLDLLESVDWSVLVTLNVESLNLSDAEKFVVATTLKNGFKQLNNDLSNITTLEELVVFDFVKYVKSFTAILATQGISIGK